MIAFGCSMTSPDLYSRYAQGGVERVREPDSPVFALQAAGSLARSYNLIMDRAGALEGLEALVLLHQDAEIRDPEICAKARELAADPTLGAAGPSGGSGAENIAWWEGELAFSSTTYHYGEAGGGQLPGRAWAPGPQRPGEVDWLDGLLLVLPPWTVRNVRFDEGLGPLHGYDFDFCRQLRAIGRKLIATPIEVIHHHSLDLVCDNEPWVAAHIRVAEKWGGDEHDWKGRARRAEAEAAAARLLVAGRQLQADASMREGSERLGEVVHSRSWRLTHPLRSAVHRLRSRRAAAPGG